MGKSTISMAMFHGYVKIHYDSAQQTPRCVTWFIQLTQSVNSSFVQCDVRRPKREIYKDFCRPIIFIIKPHRSPLRWLNTLDTSFQAQILLILSDPVETQFRPSFDPVSPHSSQVVLAHLEHLADVSSIKKRRERMSGRWSEVDVPWDSPMFFWCSLW